VLPTITEIMVLSCSFAVVRERIVELANITLHALLRIVGTGAGIHSEELASNQREHSI
jgi:hypothetical protein